MLKITLDTNCFYDYFERDPSLIGEMINFQEKGLLQIAMTTRVMSDTLDKWKGKGTSPIWGKVQGFPLVEVIGTAFRLDMSHLDSGDYIVSDEHVVLINNLQAVISKAQIEDVDHLFGHIMAGRGIFVTSDLHFLDHKERLKKQFSVTVMRPEDAVRVLKQMGKRT